MVDSTKALPGNGHQVVSPCGGTNDATIWRRGAPPGQRFDSATDTRLVSPDQQMLGTASIPSSAISTSQCYVEACIS